MFEKMRLRNLPGYAKLFVALFTALMLCVGIWAAWLYTVEKGQVDEDNLPAYMTEEDMAAQAEEEIEAIAADSAVHAPVWDSEHAGQEDPLDSADIEILEEVAEAQIDAYEPYDSDIIDDEHSRLRENLGLAHTHINGQTLLFFALGFIFLFTSVKPKLKKTLLWVFGVSVFVHAIGLSGEGFHWFFDDILALSGVVMVVVILHMSLLIFVDLARKPEEAPIE